MNKPYSNALRPHMEDVGVLQVDTSVKLSREGQALLSEAESLVRQGILQEISGLHGIRTFQPKQEDNL